MNTKFQDQGARHILYCKKCLMPTSRPRISFDENGVCNACKNALYKQNINWKEREQELLTLLEKYRSSKNPWDCIVTWSGGKDSSTVAWKLKYEYDMNPLLLTYSPMIPTEVGNHNREMMIQAGFNHLFYRPDQKVHRQLAKRFFIERGNPKTPWDAGVSVLPTIIAIRFKIPIIFHAEHGESEYGGKVLREDSSKIRDYTEIVEHQIGDDPMNWVDHTHIKEKDIASYTYPDHKKVEDVGVKAYYFSNFQKWDPVSNFYYIRQKINFRTCEQGRTEGTFTNFDSLDDKIDNLYYYMQYIKFGFGRAIRDASRQIQNGHISRDEGVKLSKLYDHEFPRKYFDEVLEYLQLNENDFYNIVDKHRNPEIWEQKNNKWMLRFPIE